MQKFYQDGIQFMIDEHSGRSILTNQHFHSLFEIYYLKQGKASYFIDDKIYTINEGDVVIIPPSTIHKSIDTSNAERKRILIYMDTSFLSEFFGEDLYSWQHVSIFNTNNRERVNHIFEELLAEYKGIKNTTLLKALLCELLILLQRKDAGDILPDDGQRSKQISEVIAYINREYMNSINLAEMAQHFFINPSYLSRLFKENTGMAFSDYLRKYRIKKAIELMPVKGKNITHIAYAVGFNSTNHFCKAFKEIMGVSPLKYRKSCEQTE